MKDKTRQFCPVRSEATRGGEHSVYHASTILYPSLDAIRTRTDGIYLWAHRHASKPGLGNGNRRNEGGAGCVLTPSGASAVALAIFERCEIGRSYFDGRQCV